MCQPDLEPVAVCSDRGDVHALKQGSSVGSVPSRDVSHGETEGRSGIQVRGAGERPSPPGPGRRDRPPSDIARAHRDVRSLRQRRDQIGQRRWVMLEVSIHLDENVVASLDPPREALDVGRSKTGLPGSPEDPNAAGVVPCSNSVNDLSGTVWTRIVDDKNVCRRKSRKHSVDHQLDVRYLVEGRDHHQAARHHPGLARVGQYQPLALPHICRSRPLRWGGRGRCRQDGCVTQPAPSGQRPIWSGGTRRWPPLRIGDGLSAPAVAGFGLMTTVDWYRAFAEFEAAGSSPRYQALATAVADDRALIERIRTFPTEKRQPNLLLAAAKFLGAPLDDPSAWLEFVHDHWELVSEQVMNRWTQTNEAARTGVFLPLLAQIPGPLALVEVGASAGLCLYPDRYRIVYDGTTTVGALGAAVTIDVDTTGPVPIPSGALQVASRTGIDRNPLDVTKDDDLRWLRACIWPEHTERAARLDAAAEIVAADPPQMVRGDLVEVVGECLHAIPADVTPVVFHSAVLNYLPPDARHAFAIELTAHPRSVWISNEGPGVVESLETDLAPPATAKAKAYFVLGVDGKRVEAISDPHGSWLRWRSS